MNPSGQLNIDGLDDHLIADVRAAAGYLSSLGALTIISDEARTRTLFGEFAAAGINLFDQYTRCQNIFQCRDATFIQLKHQKIFKTAKSEVTVLNDYDVFTLGYKQVSYDLEKLAIEPRTSGIPAIQRFLSHLFHNDEIFVDGHNGLSDRYSITTTDRSLSSLILSDTLLDTFAHYTGMHLIILRGKAFAIHDGIGATAVSALVAVLNTLS